MQSIQRPESAFPWLLPRRAGRWRRHGLLALFPLLLPATVLAGPMGEQVAAGTATVSRPDAATTLINQQSQKAVIDWQRFSIAAREQVRFQQPGAGSVALNRVIGTDPSAIYGRLIANGQIFLVNPSGVLFGPGSQVSVQGLLATTHDIGNADFMAGRYTFAGQSYPLADAAVSNQGNLVAGEGGYVVLAGDYAANSGVIEARLGQVALASGNRFTLDFDGDRLIGLDVDGASLARRAGVENFGTIVADGGRVVMTAKVAEELAATVVNNEGLVQARSIEERNGEIILQGGDFGVVANRGTLDASGGGAGETGGSVRMLGEKVGLLAQGTVDVSGASGGGTALIGGDYQGKNPDLANAAATYVSQDAVVRADATENGDGGKVVVWADDATRFYGRILARGGEQAGDGGFVEVSGKRYLDFRGAVDTRASNGGAGTLLLDPTDITITTSSGAPTAGSFSIDVTDVFDGGANDTSTIGWDYINGLLSTGNVVVQTSSSGGGSGDITFTGAGVSAGGTHSLSFLALRNVTVDAGSSIQFTSSGDLVMVAGWNPDSGYVNPTATYFFGSLGINANIDCTGGGNLKLLAKDSLTVTNATVMTNGTGSMTLSATGISIAGGGLGWASAAIIANGGSQSVTATNGITLTGGSGQYASAAITAIGGNQSVTATNGITLTGGSGETAYAAIDSTDGTQAVAVGSGGLSLTGGSGSGAAADIFRGGATADQTITVNGAGSVILQGGGAATDGHAKIFNSSTGSQTFNFTSGGALSLTGGTVGVYNSAEIGGGGNTTISGNPTVTLTGGASGTATSSAEGNRAAIDAAGAVSVAATSLSLNGGAGSYAAAVIDGATVGVTSTSTILLQGGTGGPDAGARVYSDSGAMSLAGVDINLDGSVGDASAEAVGDQTVTATNSLSVTAGAGVVLLYTTGNQTVSAGAIQILGSGSTANKTATIASAGGGSQSVTATGPDGITIVGGSQAGASAGIIADGGSQSVIALGAANGITIIGGAGQDASATIGTVNDTSQSVTVGSGGLTITGGSGDNAFADIYQDYGTLPQTITVNGGGTVTVQGGSATTGGRAKIFSNSTGDQTLDFASAGYLTIIGGSAGIHNDAGVGSSAAAGHIYVLGAPVITINGGVTGLASAADQGNSAGIFAENGRAISLNAGDLYMTGGAADYALAVISGEDITLNVSGTVNLVGGAGTEAFAAIGNDVQPTTIAINAGGAISLTGNSTFGKGLAVIGSLGGGTDITITGGSAITAQYAAIGSYAFLWPNIYGAGSVQMIANGNLTVSNTAIGALCSDVASPSDGLTLLSSTTGTLTLGANALVRGGDITLLTDSLSVDATAAIVAGTPTSYVYPNSGFVAIAPVTSTVPVNVGGTPGAGGALNLPTTALDRINPAGWLDGNGDGVTPGGGVMCGQITSPLTVTGELFEPGGMFINLWGSTISQSAGAIIHDSLSAYGGSISLPEANDVTSFTATATSGDVLFNTVAASLDIYLPLTAAGSITITSPNAVAINHNISSTGSGDITVSAGGSLSQASGVMLSTTGDGNISVSGGNISAGTGTLASSATGAISYLTTGTTTVDTSQLSTSGTITVTGLYVGGGGGGGETTTELPPTLDDCIADPSAAGCSTVLPSVDACIADPSAAGCSTVLPSVDACIANPSAAGCSVVLPSIASCTANPSAAGCSVVLPSIASCTANPSAAGCSAVLPSIASCTANPSAAGCSAVLPSIASCTANPSAAGCSAVLPSIASCTANPSAAGCSVVLPSIASCTADPSAAGCSAVLPTLDACVANPAAAGCSAVLPTGDTKPAEVVKTVQDVVTVDVDLGKVSQVEQPNGDVQSSSTPASGGNGDDEKKRQEEAVASTTTSEERPLARQPIFDLNGGGVAGQNMVCK